MRSSEDSHREPDRQQDYPALRRIDRNRIPSFIAFCATAPGERRNFWAATVPESRLFASTRSFFTSSFDHATMVRRFAFATEMPLSKKHAS